MLADYVTKDVAQKYKLIWRKALGGKNWTVERRKGLDTLDHLGLRVMSEQETKDYIANYSEVEHGA